MHGRTVQMSLPLHVHTVLYRDKLSCMRVLTILTIITNDNVTILGVVC